MLKFPLPETQKNLLQFIGLASYFRDHVRTPEAIEAFEYCQQAISNCQDLYFFEDTATPIKQTDVSDYGPLHGHQW